MKNRNIEILDCTLRDGGYYNNWNFNKDVVGQYLNCMKEASIDVVELGFRSIKKNMFMGPYFYTTDDYLSQINLPTGIPIVYEFNENLEPVSKDFLADSKSLQAAQDAVANQGKSK